MYNWHAHLGTPTDSLPAPQPPLLLGRCSFEPSSSPLRRLYCYEPILSGLSPPSLCFDRFNLMGLPPPRPRSPYCSWISPPRKPRTPRPCPRSAYIDQHTHTYRCPVTCLPLPHCPPGTSPVTSPPLSHCPPGTSPVTSLPLAHVPLDTGPMISSPLTHRPLGTVFINSSSPHAPQPMETRPVVSPHLSHRVLETGPIISPLLSPWPSGRNYNDPCLSPASSPPTGSFCHGCLKSPDSYELKTPVDLPLGKNCCGSPLPSQEGTSGCPS